MRIHSEVVQLDYNPTTDAISVEWPDIYGFSVDEIKLALEDIILNIRCFGVKRLLIDSRKTVIGISSEQYDKITTRFIKDVVASPIEKVARMESDDTAREKRLEGLIGACRTRVTFRNFAAKAEAVKWLEQEVHKI